MSDHQNSAGKPSSPSVSIPIAGHTPTPWLLGEDLEPDGGCLSRAVMASDTFIANVVFDDEDDAEAEANAAFIVRAVNSHAALVEALTDARTAIASLGRFDLGGVDVPDTHTGEVVGQYGIRDELLSKIDAALHQGAAS